MNLIINNPIVLQYCFVILVCLIIGSFLNVVIYRLPSMIYQPGSVNLFLPRSFCPNCKQTISAKHNIPIVSFLLLKGRCDGCQAHISPQYVIVELSTVLLGIIAAYQLGFSYQLGFALLFIWAMVALVGIDINHKILPDSITIGILWVGILVNSDYAFFSDGSDAIYGVIGGYLGLWIFIQIYQFISKKVVMGYGDIKLFAALGAWFGWQALPNILFFASLGGAIFGGLYLIKTKQSKETPIPFGPFLCAAGTLQLLWSPFH